MTYEYVDNYEICSLNLYLKKRLIAYIVKYRKLQKSILKYNLIVITPLNLIINGEFNAKPRKEVKKEFVKLLSTSTVHSEVKEDQV